MSTFNQEVQIPEYLCCQINRSKITIWTNTVYRLMFSLSFDDINVKHVQDENKSTIYTISRSHKKWGKIWTATGK